VTGEKLHLIHIYIYINIVTEKFKKYVKGKIKIKIKIKRHILFGMNRTEQIHQNRDNTSLPIGFQQL